MFCIKKTEVTCCKYYLIGHLILFYAKLLHPYFFLHDSEYEHNVLLPYRKCSLELWFQTLLALDYNAEQLINNCNSVKNYHTMITFAGLKKLLKFFKKNAKTKWQIHNFVEHFIFVISKRPEPIISGSSLCPDWKSMHLRTKCAYVCSWK